ncbi:unnamed protein product [Vitrella brassicaformis CCMP3155]|uniref:Plastid light harvesting protein n=2 Tax=Vitrella brassicaformis TaxID=1169539 RepID=A0A0G4FE68_VITBC|nr:unnamed protein product [Vitrella brassicaformis CCMP3155]|mmetsp:Transcript_44208/g.125077  ORF Transcript_44208/g.125077 Transcript_44208/m.125077 type:complete len:208 (+) Transcript_44208:22-645(+)|eukprot:CEM11467.1 unnamed protein product [Vitrella brassicaformis CCMP3155]
MKVVVAIALLAATAHAFVPSTPLQRMTRNAAAKPNLQMALDAEPGVTQPVGFFDPLGFSKDKGPTDETYQRYRLAEIKHGRVAMLAVIGYAVPYFFKFDGWLATDPELKFADIPAGVDALKVIPPAGLAQLFAFVGFLDLLVFKPNAEGTYVGDLGPAWWYKGPEDPEQFREYQNKELNNGRLAMLGIAASIAQDLVTDKPYPFLSK